MNNFTYDCIANEFDKTRRTVWNHVALFLDSLEAHSTVLELGCGNGKNMLYRNDLDFIGIDISKEQVNICNKKKLNCSVSNITNLLFEDNKFDYMICIATYHHLDNDIDRQRCLNEIYRTLKPNGKILITVFSMEQPINSKFKFTKSDEYVPWNKNVLRYYHIYRKDELESEIKRLNNNFKILSKGWEMGNWWIILQKN
jgi:ubiquinone/menaquinone biosynthesis C-methylase UbiE